jgi:hypothetical protein
LRGRHFLELCAIMLNIAQTVQPLMRMT